MCQTNIKDVCECENQKRNNEKQTDLFSKPGRILSNGTPREKPRLASARNNAPQPGPRGSAASSTTRDRRQGSSYRPPRRSTKSSQSTERLAALARRPCERSPRSKRRLALSDLTVDTPRARNNPPKNSACARRRVRSSL